jgi:hypothetical protein
VTTTPTNREVARTALEQICARGDMELAPSCYAEDFADHFANAEYHGLEGVRRSTALYRALFDDLASTSSTRSSRTTASPAAGC